MVDDLYKRGVIGMSEIWKDIAGYEGLYQVSSLGRAKSLARWVRNNKNGGLRLIKEHFVSQTDNGHGYKIVGLNNKHISKNKYVHRLVAEHFLSNPDGKKYVNHLDYDTANNAVANLEWCTQGENIAHSVERMRKPRTKCRPTNTGEKYITRCVYRSKHVSFRVTIKSIGISKGFKTLDDAIYFRNGVIQNGKLNNSRG